MIFSFFYFSMRVLKLLFIAALVLAYVEIGPGGQALYAIVDAFKDAILGVDWNSVADNIKASFDEAAASAKERF